MKRILLSCAFMLLLPVLGQAQIIIDNPAIWGLQHITGGGWIEHLVLVNKSDFPQKVRILSQCGLGCLLPVSFDGGVPGSEVTTVISPGQTVNFILSSAKEAKAGFILVDGGGYSVPFTGVVGSLTRENILTGEKTTTSLVRPEQLNLHPIRFGNGMDTALAVLNPPQFPANTGNTVTFRLYSEYGRLVAVEVRTSYHAGAQKAFFFSELFRGNPDWEEWYSERSSRGFSEFQGALEVVHGQGVVSASVVY